MMARIIISEEEKRRILGMHVDKGYNSTISEQSGTLPGPTETKPIQKQAVALTVKSRLDSLGFPSNDFNTFVEALEKAKFQPIQIASVAKGSGSNSFTFKMANGNQYNLLIPNQFTIPTSADLQACKNKQVNYSQELNKLKAKYNDKNFEKCWDVNDGVKKSLERDQFCAKPFGDWTQIKSTMGLGYNDNMPNCSYYTDTIAFLKDGGVAVS